MIDVFVNFLAEINSKLPLAQPVYGVQATQDDWEIIAGWILAFLVIIVLPIVLIVYFLKKKKQ